jgi:hypothetical protein
LIYAPITVYSHDAAAQSLNNIKNSVVLYC